MRNRDYVIRLLEKLDGKLSQLDFMTSRQEPLENFKNAIIEGKEIIEDLKSEVNR
jgi:hypothetical protein